MTRKIFLRKADGTYTGATTEADGMITIAKCKEIIGNASAKLGVDFVGLTLDLSTYSDAVEYDLDGNEYNPKIRDKQAHYNVAKNRLLITEGGMPIYLNDNGSVCKDRVALADSGVSING